MKLHHHSKALQEAAVTLAISEAAQPGKCHTALQDSSKAAYRKP